MIRKTHSTWLLTLLVLLLTENPRLVNGTETFGFPTEEELRRYERIDTSRDHLPSFEDMIPGECPEGSECRMVYVSIVSPLMQTLPNSPELHFDFGLLRCTEYFAFSALVVNGTKAIFYMDRLSQKKGIPAFGPEHWYKCFASLIRSDFSVTYSFPFRDTFQTTYAERRDFVRYEPYSQNVSTLHSIDSNNVDGPLREIRAFVRCDLPRPVMPGHDTDCCRASLWYVGYGLVAFLEECLLACQEGRPWGESLPDQVIDVATPIFPSYIPNWDPPPNEPLIWGQDSPGYNGVLLNDETPADSRQKKEKKDESGRDTEDQDSGEINDEQYKFFFVFILVLYGLLVLFCLVFIVVLYLIYFDKRKKLQKADRVRKEEEKQMAKTIAEIQKKNEKEKAASGSNASGDKFGQKNSIEKPRTPVSKPNTPVGGKPKKRKK